MESSRRTNKYYIKAISMMQKEQHSARHSQHYSCSPFLQPEHGSCSVDVRSECVFRVSSPSLLSMQQKHLSQAFEPVCTWTISIALWGGQMTRRISLFVVNRVQTRAQPHAHPRNHFRLKSISSPADIEHSRHAPYLH